MQLHSDGESGHQFITLPLSLVPGNVPSGGGVVGGSGSGNAVAGGNKSSIKTTNGDLLMKDINVKTEVND